MKKILALLLLLALLTGCTAGVPTETPGPTDPTPGATDATDTTDATGSEEPQVELNVHFIDVGQADAILLECDGQYMMVDGGNVADSSLVVSYLQQQGVTKLEAVVATHAHEDHVGGLSGVLAVYETAAVYAPTRTYSSKCFDDFVYYTDQQGLEIIIPSPGDVIEFGDATATVLGPVKSYAETNDTSIVLMVEFGSRRFLLTGDMETAAENDMLDYWGESFDWSCDVLKVGHHGSDTSTGYRFLNAVMPTWGVISVGKGNSYGHPCEGPLSKLRDAEVTVLRTDELGTIVFTTDGNAVSSNHFTVTVPPDHNVVPDSTEATETEPTETEATEDQVSVTYIGNKNSKKLHLPTCKSLPAEKNRVYFDDYDEAIAAGYTPCTKCMR